MRHSPDFATMAEADALADLQDRIGHYEKIYDTVPAAVSNRGGNRMGRGGSRMGRGGNRQ